MQLYVDIYGRIKDESFHLAGDGEMRYYAVGKEKEFSMAPSATIQQVEAIEPHPDNHMLRNPLDLVHIADSVNVATRLAPDQPRYKVGDFAVVLTENLVLPEWLLKHMGLWNEEKGKGLLAGSKGNRTRSRMVAKVLSEVALCKVTIRPSRFDDQCWLCLDGDDWTWVCPFPLGDDPTGLDLTSDLEIQVYQI